MGNKSETSHGKRHHFLKSYAKTIGISLQQRMKEQQIELPTTPTLSTLFGAIQDSVRAAWIDEMTLHLSDAIFNPAVQSMSDEEKQQMLREDTYESLNTLRLNGSPEGWFAMVGALSKREELTARVAHNYIEKLNDKECKENFGYSKPELLLFADLSGELQSPIDDVYIKQMEFHPENPEEYRMMKGAEYFYISKSPHQNTRINPLITQFPHEIKAITSVLEKYALRIENELQDKILDVEKYAKLPSYLRQMAGAFQSTDTSLSATDSMWSAIRRECARLSEEVGCPLIINPISFPGDGGHIDIELLVGMKDTANTDLQNTTHEISKTVNSFAEEVGVESENMPLVPTVFFRSLIHSGSNLSMSATANSTREYIAFNLAGDHKDSHYLFDTYADSILTHPSSNKEYLSWRAIATSAHELGHLLKINMGHDHLGEGINQNKLEELKADTLGALYFLRSNSHSKDDYDHYLEVYLIDYIEEIQSYLRNPNATNPNDSSYWYAFSGLTILNQLFKSEAIGIKNNKISILDGKKGIEAMADLGEEIARIYVDETVSPSQVDDWVVKHTEEAMNNSNVKWYANQILNSL